MSYPVYVSLFQLEVLVLLKNFLIGVNLILLFAFCDSPTNSTVGSNEDIEINNMSYIIDTTYLESSIFYVKGKVTNLGNSPTESPWYVEAQFYTDSTYRIKLGGSYTKVGVPLEPYQSTFWSLSFSTATVDLNKYPNFRVGDFRAIYKK